MSFESTKVKLFCVRISLLLLIGFFCLVSCGDDPSPPDSGPVADSSVEIVVHPGGGEVDARLVSTETSPQNNCGGTSPVTNSIERSLAVMHTVEMASGLEVSANGGLSVPGIGQVSVGTAVSAHYGKSFGTQARLINSR